MRLFSSFIFSLGIVFSIFFGMEKMTASEKRVVEDNKEPILLSYLREKRETKIQKQKRVKPKKPVEKVKHKKVEPIKTKVDTKVVKNVKIKPLKMVNNIDISPISSLSGVQVAVAPQIFDANSLQTISRANPHYPRKAKIRRVEGYVTLQFHINQDGSIINPIVIEANPQGFFEESALKAIKRWRFNPSDSAKDATITFNFRLAK